MAIPDFQTIMLPLLWVTSDGQEHSLQELVERLAEEFNLTEDELGRLLPSGRQTTFSNRVGWAKTYLAKAGLLEITRRSYCRITERGIEVLRSNPPKIDVRYLEQFPEFLEFRRSERRSKEIVESTPEEVLDEAYQEMRNNLAQELLDAIKQSPPSFFERVVVELLVRMGYGGSHQDAARAVGRAGDEGIDGVIDEDRLGLDVIYIQAKRWDSTVGRPEIQKFVGALMGKKAKKGIFITTSAFSPDAVSYVSNIDYKIVLIDGTRLAELMIDYDVGVSTVTTYQIKKVDNDYFGMV